MLQVIKLSLIFLLVNLTSQSCAAESMTQKNLDQIYQEANELNKQIFIQVDDKAATNQTKLKSIMQSYIPKQGVIFTLISELEDIYLQHRAHNNIELGHEYGLGASEHKDLPDEQKNYLVLKDISHKLRDMQKASNHLQSESKLAKTELEKDQIDARLRQVQKQKDALHIEKKNLIKRRAEGDYSFGLVEQTQFTSEQKVAEDNRKDFFQKTTQAILAVLCQQRQVLPSMPRSENISLVLQQGGDKVQERYRDSIMSFTLENVSTCVRAEISTNELFNNSVRYQF